MLIKYDKFVWSYWGIVAWVYCWWAAFAWLKFDVFHKWLITHVCFPKIYTEHYLHIVGLVKACSYYIHQSFLWAKCQSSLDWYHAGLLMYWDFCHKNEANWVYIDKGKFAMLNLMTRNVILMSFWDVLNSYSLNKSFMTIPLLDKG